MAPKHRLLFERAGVRGLTLDNPEQEKSRTEAYTQKNFFEIVRQLFESVKGSSLTFTTQAYIHGSWPGVGVSVDGVWILKK